MTRLGFAKDRNVPFYQSRYLPSEARGAGPPTGIEESKTSAPNGARGQLQNGDISDLLRLERAKPADYLQWPLCGGC